VYRDLFLIVYLLGIDEVRYDFPNKQLTDNRINHKHHSVQYSSTHVSH